MTRKWLTDWVTRKWLAVTNGLVRREVNYDCKKFNCTGPGVRERGWPRFLWRPVFFFFFAFDEFRKKHFVKKKSKHLLTETASNCGHGRLSLKGVCFTSKPDLSGTTRESYHEGKDQYSWPPCMYLLVRMSCF